MVYKFIHGILFSQKKNQTGKSYHFVATCMDFEGIMPSKISQSKAVLYLTYMWNLKKREKNQTPRKRDQTCGYQRQGVR